MSEEKTYDYVGIVMAKSEEGDAVASVMGAKEGVEIIEQPSFWEIRAKDRRLVLGSDLRRRLAAVDYAELEG